MFNKKIASELAVGVVIIISLVIGAIFWMQNEKTEEVFSEGLIMQPVVNQQNKLKDEFADWKTYKNDKFGFELKYPNYMEIDSTDYTDKDQAPEGYFIEFDAAKEGENIFSMSSVYPAEESFSYNLRITKSDQKDIEVWFANWKKDFEKPSNYEGFMIQSEVTEIENASIDGLPAKKYRTGSFPFYDSCYTVLKNVFVYDICYDSGMKPEEKTDAIIRKSEDEGTDYDEVKLENIRMKYREELAKIISTFKFTNS